MISDSAMDVAFYLNIQAMKTILTNTSQKNNMWSRMIVR